MAQGSRIVLMSLILVLAGCNQEFEDISSRENYRDLVNREYRTIQPLLIHGLTMNNNNRKVTDYFAITKEPGMDGPEVLSSARVEVGSVIKIKKILRCSNCFFGSPEFIEVYLDTEGLMPDIPVRMYRLDIVGDDGKVDVAPAFFEPI